MLMEPPAGESCQPLGGMTRHCNVSFQQVWIATTPQGSFLTSRQSFDCNFGSDHDEDCSGKPGFPLRQQPTIDRPVMCRNVAGMPVAGGGDIDCRLSGRRPVDHLHPLTGMGKWSPAVRAGIGEIQEYEQ